MMAKTTSLFTVLARTTVMKLKVPKARLRSKLSHLKRPLARSRSKLSHLKFPLARSRSKCLKLKCSLATRRMTPFAIQLINTTICTMQPPTRRPPPTACCSSRIASSWLSTTTLPSATTPTRSLSTSICRQRETTTSSPLALAPARCSVAVRPFPSGLLATALAWVPTTTTMMTRIRLSHLSCELAPSSNFCCHDEHSLVGI
ncbi:hypothetical protein F5B17DRAFT_417508 [Nemania serpens]|nr:hypothetical protein F5B17DRAFT_417508 [Nemania serpens]